MRSRNRRNRRQIRPSATSTLHNHRLSIINVLRCTAKDRARRRLAEDLRAGPRLPLGQARRSELPGSDLRNARRGRRRGWPPAHLVPPEPGLIGTTRLRHRRGLLSCREIKAGSGIEPGPAFLVPYGEVGSCSERVMVPSGNAGLKHERCPQFAPPALSSRFRKSAPPLPGSAGRWRDP